MEVKRIKLTPEDRREFQFLFFVKHSLCEVTLNDLVDLPPDMFFTTARKKFERYELTTDQIDKLLKKYIPEIEELQKTNNMSMHICEATNELQMQFTKHEGDQNEAEKE